MIICRGQTSFKHHCHQLSIIGLFCKCHILLGSPEAFTRLIIKFAACTLGTPLGGGCMGSTWLRGFDDNFQYVRMVGYRHSSHWFISGATTCASWILIWPCMTSLCNYHKLKATMFNGHFFWNRGSIYQGPGTTHGPQDSSPCLAMDSTEIKCRRNPRGVRMSWINSFHHSMNVVLKLHRIQGYISFQLRWKSHLTTSPTPAKVHQLHWEPNPAGQPGDLDPWSPGPQHLHHWSGPHWSTRGHPPAIGKPCWRELVGSILRVAYGEPFIIVMTVSKHKVLLFVYHGK